MFLLTALIACNPSTSDDAVEGYVAVEPAVGIPMDLDDSTANGEVEAATVVLSDDGGNTLGVLTVTHAFDSMKVVGSLEGLTPGSIHGLHIHENRTCGDGDFSAAGGHFAPHGNPHGSPTDGMHHVGDLGNVEADADGVAVVDMVTDELAFEGDAGVLGRAVVLHAGRDDLQSQPAGDAGARMACGTVDVTLRAADSGN